MTSSAPHRTGSRYADRVHARTTLASALLAACAASGDPAPTADPPAPPTPALAPCPTPPPPPLDYNDIANGRTYTVDVAESSGEWRPADHIPMPMHHATRIEWTNPAALSDLGPAATGRLRLAVRIESRDIQQLSGRREWRVIVRAHIAAVCAAPA